IVMGVLLGAGVVLNTGDDTNVQVLSGTVNSVDHEGAAIGFEQDGSNTGEGYVVAGARWRGFDGTWHDGRDPETGHPTCLEPQSSGQRVRLGVVDARSGEGPSGPVVAWLQCLTPATERWAAAGRSG
ncbi:MAG: hypothetical protein MJD61_06190, partial [Proteobacteria bacterium]|nr:hypothetical protein [Pseudomonadota bacterium]